MNIGMIKQDTVKLQCLESFPSRLYMYIYIMPIEYILTNKLAVL